MKKFFKEAEREKEKSKIIELSFGMNFEDIKDNFEEVDPNGEEKTQEKKEIIVEQNKETPVVEPENKNKKKKNKKK